jgi:hypothetical protein
VFLARGVIITLTPLCNDDRKLIVLDKGTNNTCAEVERVVMVVINDIIVGDKIGACDVVIITNVNTTTTIVGGISITLETDIIIPEIIQGVKRLKSYGTKILCHTRNCL